MVPAAKSCAHAVAAIKGDSGFGVWQPTWSTFGYFEQLRKKIEADPLDPRWLTVPRLGYRFDDQPLEDRQSHRTLGFGSFPKRRGAAESQPTS